LQLNPSWNEESNDAVLDVSPSTALATQRPGTWLTPLCCCAQAKFQVASQLAGSEFDAALKRAAHSWYPARHLIETAVKSRKTHNSSGKLIVFDDFAPWKVRRPSQPACTTRRQLTR
jgi:hypothetical protein